MTIIRADAAASRRLILDTAYTLFKRDGFHATGMDRIIATAAIAKMTLYRHFPTKEDLILAVLDWRQTRFDRQLDRLLRNVTTPDEGTATIFDWYERWMQGPGFAGCLFQHALAEFGDPEHPVFKAAAGQKTSLRRRMAAILEAKVSVADAARLASELLILIEGATVLARLGQGAAAIRDARRAALTLVAAAS